MTATPARKCERCGSRRLGLVHVGVGYWRKECRDCGSTGPFPLAPLVRAAAGGAADKPTLNEPESKLKPLIGPGPSEGGCDDSANAKRPSAPGSLSAAADRPGSEPA